MACLSVAIPSGGSLMLLVSERQLPCVCCVFTQQGVKEQGNLLRQCVKWCLTRMSHSVFVHYIFNILLLLFLLIGFLYPMPFIYKDTKNTMFVILITFSIF
ncbi:hypothetical protein ACRRTK_009297 [Alexandromys fortis]